MGIYGKYTKPVTIFSITQIVAGVLMICLGIAHRVLVCSWITDIAFGFWVGLLVIVGGVIGYYSATSDNYNYISAYLCFNSFTIIFAVLVIFCHSLASVHFISQMDMPANYTNSTNTTLVNGTASSPNPTNFSNLTNSTTFSKASPTNKATTIKPKPKRRKKPRTKPTTPKPTNATAGPPGPACYTHQTWSDYENGARGVGLGASMMFVCFVELLMSIMSMASCWAATKVQPTEIARKKVTVQGTVTEIISSTEFEMMPRRRRGGQVTQVSHNVYDNVWESPSGSQMTDESEGIENHIYERITTTPTSSQSGSNF